MVIVIYEHCGRAVAPADALDPLEREFAVHGDLPLFNAKFLFEMLDERLRTQKRAWEVVADRDHMSARRPPAKKCIESRRAVNFSV